MTVRCAISLVAAAALAGCVVNGVRPLAGTASGSRGDRAVVVVGITVAGAWRYPQFGVILDQYDRAQQRITGDCFSYNRIEAVVAAVPAPTRFLAFEVPAGDYVYSAFNTARFAGNDQAFQAGPGHAVYVGNFALGDNGVVTLRSDLAADRVAIAQALPRLAAGLEMAHAVTVVPASPFFCTP